MKKLFTLILGITLAYSCSTSSDGNGNSTTTVVPIAPTNLIGLVISTSQVNLSWTDNSTNEVGFKIERKIFGGTYALLNQTGNNVTNFSDQNVQPNTSYTYRVYAYNSVGESLTYTNEVTVFTAVVPVTGLVAYYPFNGNANDESGNGNNGTVNGATLTADRNGNINSAYSFNGTSNNIKINNATNLNNPSVSVSGWFYTNTNATDTFSGAKSIIGKYWDYPSNCNSNYNSYIFCLAKQNNNSTVCLGTNFYSGNVFYYNQPINIGNWYHFTFVHDSNSGGKIYINGQLVASNTTSGSICNGINPIYIGADITNGNLFRFFNGKIDDICIYNRSLTQNEISYLATH